MSEKSDKSTKDEVPQAILSQEIIRDHVMYAMGGSLIPIPLLDLAAVTAIQLDMLKQLANVYDLDYSETSGKALVGALTGNMMIRVGSSLFKVIPGIGSILGGISQVVLSGAATYALGDVFVRHATEGGTFQDLDIEVLKKYYEEKYEEGKKKAAEWKEEMEKDFKEVEIEIKEVVEDAVDKVEEVIEKDDQSVALQKLKELGELKEKGVISASEFASMKKQIKEEFKEAGKPATKKPAAKKSAAKKKPAAKKPTARKKAAPKKKPNTDKDA